MQKIRIKYEGAVDIEYDRYSPLFESALKEFRRSVMEDGTIDDFLNFVAITYTKTGSGISISPIGLPGDLMVESDIAVKILREHDYTFSKAVIK